MVGGQWHSLPVTDVLMPTLLLSRALERHRVQGQGSEGEQSERAVRACDSVSTLEQLPPGRKGSKWCPFSYLLLVLQSAVLSTSQRTGVCVSYDQGFHRGHYPVGTPQSGHHKDQKARI